MDGNLDHNFFPFAAIEVYAPKKVAQYNLETHSTLVAWGLQWAPDLDSTHIELEVAPTRGSPALHQTLSQRSALNARARHELLS
jgi:hypothetical protein